MKALLRLWEFISGKKTIFGGIVLFVDGGLLALGYDIPGLNELGMAFAGVGVVHKIWKK